MAYARLTDIEVSIAKSIDWVAFERNVPYTWERARLRVEEYLAAQWRAGTLVGATPAQAFFVNCDAGLTMTKADLDEGRFVLEVGIAPVRPGDFVVMTFVHSLSFARA